MNLKVYKYPMKISAKWQVVEIPEHALFLRFDIQNEVPCLWMAIPEIPPKNVKRNFIIIPTGVVFNFPDGEAIAYRGTAFETESATVWHCFEKE